MKRTLKRESKELEIVEREAFAFSGCPLRLPGRSLARLRGNNPGARRGSNQNPAGRGWADFGSVLKTKNFPLRGAARSDCIYRRGVWSLKLLREFRLPLRARAVLNFFSKIGFTRTRDRKKTLFKRVGKALR